MIVYDHQTVLRLAQRLGFALAGIVPAQPSAFAEYVRRWLSQAKHGQMSYLDRNLQLRLDPRVLLPGARSVICVADRYPASCDFSRFDSTRSPSTASPVDRETTADTRASGRIARYAWGDDYHRVIKKRLFELVDELRAQHPEHRYKVAVDTAPILEREHAARAGLGWVGKHTLLIHPRLGSWLLLGEIVTTLPLEHGPVATAPVVDHCGTCTRCIDACPTGCISPYQLDAQRCISYLTIEYRDRIDPRSHDAMDDWIAGCDVCQEVCPYNQPERLDGSIQPSDPSSWSNTHPDYAPRPPGPVLRLIDVLGWEPRERQEAFTRSALKRIKLDMLKRNALIAAGNYLASHLDRPLVNRIKQLAMDADEPPLVRLTARDVLDRLDVTPATTPTDARRGPAGPSRSH